MTQDASHTTDTVQAEAAVGSVQDTMLTHQTALRRIKDWRSQPGESSVSRSSQYRLWMSMSVAA